MVKGIDDRFDGHMRLKYVARGSRVEPVQNNS
jgi:hypothetical protein